MPTGSLDEGARKLLWIQYHGVMPHSRGGQQNENGRRKARQKKSREKEIQEKCFLL